MSGVLIESVVSVGNMTDYGKNAYIARFSNLSSSSTYFTPGIIDDVSIYNRALSQEEIDQLHNAPNPVPGLATADVYPDTLNKKSKGKYITCYIEFPEGYDVEDIDLATVAITRINDSDLDPPLYTTGPTENADYDDDEIADCMVKFDRQSMQDVCNVGVVQVVVYCELYDGTSFEGNDTMLVIDKGQEHFAEDYGSVVY